MNALLTGSRVYGTPNADSDVDLVVLVSHDDYQRLLETAEPDLKEKDKRNYDGVGGLRASIRFGKLNLLVCTDPLAFEVWRRGTERLKRDADASHAPVDRDTAVRLFNDLRAHCGLHNAEPQVRRQ